MFVRLATSLKDLQDIVRKLKTRGVALKLTEHPVDTGTRRRASWIGFQEL
jgi:hypothetical protein